MTLPPTGLADANMAPLPEPTPAWRTGHDVHFYDDDAGLMSSVSRFLLEGVRAGQPMIVIATSSHRKHLQEKVKVLSPDAFDTASIVWLDARETLSAFMEGSRPSAELFHATIGRVFDKVVANRSYLVVRAYGEMVDLLWSMGNIDGAIELEQLWNDIATKYSFNLLCAYSKGASLKNSPNEAFARICSHHGKVVACEA